MGDNSDERWCVNITDRRTYEIGLEISNYLKDIPENSEVRLQFDLNCEMYDIFSPISMVFGGSPSTE